MSSPDTARSSSDYHGAPLLEVAADWPEWDELWPAWAPRPPSPPYQAPADQVAHDLPDEGAIRAKRLRKNRNRNKNKNKNKNRRKAAKLPVVSEVESLRLELSAIHSAYRGKIDLLEEEITLLHEEKREHTNMWILREKSICNHNKKEVTRTSELILDLRHDLEITEEECEILQTSEKVWTGATLKLKFVMDEIFKIGALPLDHVEWVRPMIDDIEIPEVSIDVKDRFVPTRQTDNIDYASSDEDWDSEDDDSEMDSEEDVIGEQDPEEERSLALLRADPALAAAAEAAASLAGPGQNIVIRSAARNVFISGLGHCELPVPLILPGQGETLHIRAWTPLEWSVRRRAMAIRIQRGWRHYCDVLIARSEANSNFGVGMKSECMIPGSPDFL